MPGILLPDAIGVVPDVNACEYCASSMEADTVALNCGLSKVLPASSKPLRAVPGAFLYEV